MLEKCFRKVDRRNGICYVFGRQKRRGLESPPQLTRRKEWENRLKDSDSARSQGIPTRFATGCAY